MTHLLANIAWCSTALQVQAALEAIPAIGTGQISVTGDYDTGFQLTFTGLLRNQADDFTVRDQTQVAEMAEQTAGTLTMLLGSIAAISLVVGGIGIMNIMLVSVVERTREIGIRKAVGAKRRDILIQFLAEALVLSLAGGFAGILVGDGGAQVVTPLLGGSRALVTPQSVVMALGVSIAVGLFFGLYPAYRAAQSRPIEALPYE